MKKLILPLVAVLLCMAGCQKENGILYLETETYCGDAKLHLDDEHFAVWDNNDLVLVNGTEYAVAVGSGNATITGVPEASAYTAIYPAGWASTTGITYPAEQIYSATSTEAPMAAYSDGGTLMFHNLGSLLAVKVTNSGSEAMSVQKIEISAEGSTLINGTAAIDFSGDRPTLGTLNGGTATTTLKCNGASIAAGNSKTFFIAMPPVEAQLTIKVYDQYYAYTKTQGSAHAMEANYGYTAPVTTSDSPVQYAPMGNQIWYTATEQISSLYAFDAFSIEISDHTFSNGQGVITFANNITTIPSDAFYRCDVLQTITLSADVTAIESSAFVDCINLTSITAPNVTFVGFGAFGSCGTSTTNGVTFNLPNLETIDDEAFSGCKIMDLDLSNVTSIGGSAFYQSYWTNSNMTIDLSNVSIFGYYPFQYLQGQTINKVILPISPSSIDEAIFPYSRITHIYYYSAAEPTAYSWEAFQFMSVSYIHLPANTPGEVVYYWINELHANKEKICRDL